MSCIYDGYCVCFDSEEREKYGDELCTDCEYNYEKDVF